MHNRPFKARIVPDADRDSNFWIVETKGRWFWSPMRYSADRSKVRQFKTIEEAKAAIDDLARAIKEIRTHCKSPVIYYP